MFTVHTFAMHSRENGRPVGQAVICPEARYLSVKWAVYASAERRIPTTDEWTTITEELDATLPSAELTPSGPIVKTLGGDRAELVSVRYLDQQRLPANLPADVLLDEFDRRLRSLQAGWWPLTDSSFTYDIEGRVLTLRPVGTPTEQQRSMAYETIVRDQRVPERALVLLDARQANAPSDLRDLERRARTLVSALGPKLGHLCAVIVPPHLINEALHLHDFGDPLGVRIALFSEEDQARRWLDKFA